MNMEWLYITDQWSWERKSLLRQKGPDLKRLIERIAVHFRVDVKDLKSGSKVRTIAKAHAVLCYLGVRKLGLTSACLAKELEMSPSAVSKSIVRAQGVPECPAIEKSLFECQ